MLAQPPLDRTHCNCTICAKTGTLCTYCAPDDLFVESDVALAVYRRTPAPTLDFCFCSRCSCMVQWRAIDPAACFAESAPPYVGVNARLLDIDLAALPVIENNGLAR